jgi:REP element-mobilizing transposase RayT
LKGQDYAGGGLYFVTLCAHRDFIVEAKGAPFGAVGARQASPVREVIEERMRITAEKCPFMRWEEAVIMPDHFHALIRLEGGHLSLGNVLGGFKSAVSRELHRRAEIDSDLRIWHRNYYEMIVRTREAEEKIRNYIRMNPWRCVQSFKNGLRGMGNPSLWNLPTLGICCSRNAPKPKSIPNARVYVSGFHSPMEKEIFARLLELKKPMIWCPAWGLGGVGAGLVPPVLDALENNRMLILEMRNCEGDLAAAEERNRFVLETADRLWLPHVTPGGMLDRLMQKMDVQKKRI